MTQEIKDTVELDDLPSLDEITARIDKGTQQIKDAIGDWIIAGVEDPRMHGYLYTFDIMAVSFRQILVGLATELFKNHERRNRDGESSP